MTKEQKKVSILGIVLAVVIGGGVLAYTGLSAGVFKAPETPNADAAARQFEGRRDLTDPAYLEKVAAAGIADAEKRGWIPAGVPDLNGGFTQTAPATKPEAIVPIAGWTAKVVYLKKDSAKGKVDFRRELRQKEEYYFVENLMKKPISVKIYGETEWLNEKGRVYEGIYFHGSLLPGEKKEITSFDEDSSRRMVKHSFWVEVD